MAGLVPALASHLVGGELTYKFLDAAGPVSQPFRYRVTARIYFNKEDGSAAPNGTPSIPIRLYSKAPGKGLLLSVNVLRDSFVEITPATPPGCAALAPRVTLAIYDTIFSLPVVPEGYVAQFTSAARNVGITNLRTPSTEGITLAVDLTPGTLPNTSPEFTSDALIVVCRGQTVSSLNNAYDADGDRLSYSLVAPAGNPDFSTFIPTTVSVQYAAGYSATQPFGNVGMATIDAGTGLAQYRSSTQGYFALAVDVQEYRMINGKEILLATLRRDIQVAVLNCNGPDNSSPVFSAATLAQRDMQVEEGQALQFNIMAQDPDNQRLTMTVSSGLLDGAGPIEATLNGQPGAPVGTRAVGVVQVTGQGTVSGIFSLRAGCGLARVTPYDIVVTVADEACASKVIAQVFRITVVRPKLIVRIRGDSVVCAGSTVSYTAVGPVLDQYRWITRGGQVVGSPTSRTVQVRWSNAGKGVVTVSGLLANGCLTDSVSHLVTIGSGPIITGPTTYCAQTRKGLRYTVDGIPSAFQWTVTDGLLVSGQGTNEVRVDINEGAVATIQVVDLASPSCPTLLRVEPDRRCLAFYNIITPNGDHLNDVFVITNLAYHPGTALAIFNRWGHSVYQTEDYQNTYNGEGVSAGLYFYLCRLTDGTTYKGWFEIVR
ncbi:gliding motility-associated C-terminal domain-containing protein [Hymenobacter sp. GOD-10R]|uniref:T9SS type B sorting domain-containing protein n=1 Tax=Hymenobacter sp. GOD-10R TaxID=3093922 RepID=UPI002D77D93C|nr:gliding motility-associated C-terminal domain-containing protein [Hymenobacter sp. GOD-10R]WRQ26241.1 gliding motility-associated C-terminal domain-containing protein [Hymenobacter sp. GOD-10R]